MISYNEAIIQTNRTIQNMLKNTPQDIKEMTGQLADAMGKGIRARLLLACAMDNDNLVSEDAIKLAAAIEIFHLATLVHDDVIDDSPLRRGIPTTQSLFGRKQAVICGDYLLCLSISKLTEIYKGSEQEDVYLLTKFIDSITKICIGEHKQSVNLGNMDLDMQEYVRIITGKTAMLFYIAAYAGAITSDKKHINENKKKINALANCGRSIGIMFQIADDLKDYEETEATALKPVKRDIADGVVTLPLILAMADNPVIKELTASVLNNKTDVMALVHEVCSAGGTKGAKRIHDRYKKRAEKFLDIADVSNEKRNILLGLINIS